MRSDSIIFSAMTLILLALIFLILQMPASAEILYWQPGHLVSERQVLSARFTARSGGTQQPLTEIQVTGQPGQTMIVCAQLACSHCPGWLITSVDERAQEETVYKITMLSREASLPLTHITPCQSSPEFQSPYYHLKHILFSDQPFMAVIQDKANPQEDDDPDTRNQPPALSLAGLPVNLSPQSQAMLSASGGYGGDSGPDDHSLPKRPSGLPFDIPGESVLMLALILRLISDRQTQLSASRWYHWLIGDPDYEAGISITLSYNGQQAGQLQLNRAETLELVQHLGDTQQLLHWLKRMLAPGLSGRESFIQTLLALSSTMTAGQIEEDRDLLEKLEAQLAIALEQPDIEFSLEFELQTLATTLSRIESPFAGIIQLPERAQKGQNPQMQNSAAAESGGNTGSNSGSEGAGPGLSNRAGQCRFLRSGRIR